MYDSAPFISGEPVSQTAFDRQSASFQVLADGSRPFSYQWQFNGADILGGTNPNLTLSNLRFSNQGDYAVVISNALGVVTSKVAQLTVLAPPSIISQPHGLTTNTTASATFSVTASGTAPLRYQWCFNGANIAGATNDNYTISNLKLANAGSYTVVVRNNYGAVTSAVARLTVFVCSFGLSPVSTCFSTNGGSTNINVTTACDWIASTTNDWITVTNGSSSGNGTFSYTVAPNSGLPRAGYIKVGTQIHPVAQQGTLPSGRMDFTGDGQPDILLQNSSGAVMTWAMNGTNRTSTFLLNNGVRAAGWRLFGQGDFNNDGKTDIALQNVTTRRIAFWFMDGTNRIDGATLNPVPGIGWHAMSAADFNSDGKPDILFQSVERKSAVWFMDGTNCISGVLLRDGAAPPVGWQIVGTSDFNDDGQTDIVWDNSSGPIGVWHLIGTTFIGSAYLRSGPAAATGWRIGGVGDASRDGRPQLLWQNRDGRIGLWFFADETFIYSSYVHHLEPGWWIVGPR